MSTYTLFDAGTEFETAVAHLSQVRDTLLLLADSIDEECIGTERGEYIPTALLPTLSSVIGVLHRELDAISGELDSAAGRCYDAHRKKPIAPAAETECTGGLTLAEVRAELVRIIQAEALQGGDVVRLLRDMGARTLRDLPPEKFSEFLSRVRRHAEDCRQVQPV